MRDILKLMRIKHWIKNFLVFIPIVFFKSMDVTKWFIVFGGWLAFGFMASAVYIINDIRDVEKDRQHEIKKNRPIASGTVSIRKGVLVVIVLLLISFGFNIVFSENKMNATIVLCVYLIINILYSIQLKEKPIIDVVILATGFVIRVLYGGCIVSIDVSPMLILTVAAFALYMGLGKRRNEKSQQKRETRAVLNFYTHDFLDKNMYMCMSLGIVFYSIWALSVGKGMVYTVMVVIIICMRYSFIVENDSSGDPVDVLLSDKILVGLVITFAIIIVLMLFLI